MVLTMLAAAFALGVGVMSVVEGDDGAGAYLRSARATLGDDSSTPAAAVPVTAESDADGSHRSSRFAILDEIYAELDQLFVEPDVFEATDTRRAAIDGIIDALGDPHTVFIDAEDYRLSSEDVGGSFEGIGARVTTIDNQIVITLPFSGSPAERAGIRAGDIILAVDGDSTAGWPQELAVSRIRGRAGTTVELLVRHTDGEEELLIVERARIIVPSVTSLAITDRNNQPVADIGYIQIRQFTNNTPSELRELLDAAENAGLTKLIIDLRGNPGGLLRATVATTGEFVDRAVILNEHHRDGSTEVFRDERGGRGLDLDLAILVDSGSASGSEVMAAALRDLGRAVIIGETTGGKGTVNLPRQLSDGSVLYVSTARWTSPNGTQIEGVGVVPDITVVQPDTGFDAETDTQLNTAIDYLRGEWTPPEPEDEDDEDGTEADDGA